MCVLVEAVAKRRDHLKQEEVIHAAVRKINLGWVVLRKLEQGCCQKKRGNEESAFECVLILP